MNQQDLIAAVAESMAGKPGLDALFLAGSFGRGTADDWSDVDFLALARPEHHASLAAAWRQVLETITPIVFWQELNRGGILLNAISEDWLRCDLSIADTLGTRAKNTVRPLFDPGHVHDTLPDSLPAKTPDPGTVHYLIHEFIRMMGLMPVGAGRGEYVTMVLGVGMMRGHLEALLMQDVTLPDPGGILHQSKLLGPEQMALLRSLPYPPPDRDAVIAANFAIAREFIPRARAMAERLGIDWPESFEAATRKRLRLTLGEDVANNW